MNEQEEEKINLDILRHVENISRDINEGIGGETKTVFRRYPITFGLLTLFGVVAVSEGVKGILEGFDIFVGHPWYQLLFGLFVLIVTGSLYKKLDK